MSTQTYTIRIQRNDQQPDGSIISRWDSFQVSSHPKTPVLNLLELIRGTLDGTITYRMSCRSAICGSCAMKINGRTRLACKTHIGDVADCNHMVELAPQGNQPILKDLAVDITNFFKKIHYITPFLQEGSESDSCVGRHSFDQVNNVSQCILCGTCYSECVMVGVNRDVLGPAALAKSFRFVSDPREGRKSERLKQLSEPHGIWSCSRCTQCVSVCPKDVAPMEAVVKLRTRAMDKGLTDNIGARHAIAFHQDIQKGCDLNEFTLMIRSLGVRGTLREAATVLHLLKKGKIPSPFSHQAEGGEELQKIYQILEQHPLDVETKAEELAPD